MSAVERADLDLFQFITTVVGLLPDGSLGKDVCGTPVVLSCHILVRALVRVIRKMPEFKAHAPRVVDGYFHPNFQHSWLQTASGNVIDVYPVGILGGPLYVNSIHCRDFKLKWVAGMRVRTSYCGLYLRTSTERISEGRFSQPWFKQAVSLTARRLDVLV